MGLNINVLLTFKLSVAVKVAIPTLLKYPHPNFLLQMVLQSIRQSVIVR